MALTEIDHQIWHGIFYALAGCSLLGSIWLLFIIPAAKELRVRSTNILFWTIAVFHIGYSILYIPWNFTDYLYGY